MLGLNEGLGMYRKVINDAHIKFHCCKYHVNCLGALLIAEQFKCPSA